MSDKTPKDEFDELWFGVPESDSEELPEDIRNFSFDDPENTSDLQVPEEPVSAPAPETDVRKQYSEQEGALFAAFRNISRGPDSIKEEPVKTEQKEEPANNNADNKDESGNKVDALASAFRRMNVAQDKLPSEESKPAAPVQKKKPAASKQTSSVSPSKEATGKKNPDNANGSKSSDSGKKEKKEKKSEQNQLVEKKEKAPAAPSRRERKALARWIKENAEMDPAPVTVGRNLRGDQMLVYDSELDEIDYTDDEDLPEARDYYPIRFRRYGRLGLGGGIMYALFVIGISIVLACLAWMFAADVLALNKEAHSAVVVLNTYEPGEGDPTVTMVDDQEKEIRVDIDQVATELKNNGIIEYKWLFKLFSRFSHAETKMDPGTYDVSTELDYRALVTALQFGSGNQEITRVTFPEGYTLDQIFDLLEENQICHKTDLYEAAANYEFNYEFLEDIPYGDAYRLEGYLFPDTYDFYQNESASVAINRFLRNLDNKLTDEVRNAAAAQGLSIREMLTMASLIEKEAGSDEERPIMASVIYNRLNAGMPLQLDCTLNYIKGTSTFDLTYEDIEIDSPYNTYQNTGLPPGPICNPGSASIQAVIEPDSTDYWYWYAVDGVSTFFTNADEFNAFAAAHPY